MSSDTKAELEVSIDADKFSKGSDKVQKGFNEIEKSAESAGSGASSAMDDVGDSASKMGDDVKKAGDKGERAMDDMGDAAEESGRDMAAVGVSVLGLGQAIGGLSDSIFGFNEKLIALEKSAFGVEETTRDLTRAAEDLNDAMREGTLQGRELTRSIEDLDFIYRKLEIEQKEVLAEQEALNSEFVNFGLTLVQTVSFGILTVSTLLSTQQKAMIALRAQTLLLSKTFGILIFNTNKFKIAMIGATLSLKGLAIGMKAVVASMGPIGIALTVGITLWTIWESNVGGVQEKMFELWETIKKFLPVLQSLELLVNGLFPEASAEVGEFNAAVDGAKFSTQELVIMLEEGKISAEEFAIAVGDASTTTQQGTESLSEYNSTLGLANSSTMGLTKSTNSMGSSMSNVPDWYRSATSSIKEYKKELTETQKEQAKWIKMQEKVSRLNQKKTNDSEIDPNTGEPKTVTRKKASVTREFMNSLPPELRGNFRVSNGPGEVNSASLQKQRAAQAIVNAERRKTRDKFRQIREAVSILAFLKSFGIDLPGATQSRQALFRKVRKGRMEFQKRFGPFGFSVADIKRLDPSDVFAAVQLQKDQRAESGNLAVKNNLDADEIFNERKSFGGSVFQAARFVNRNTFFQKKSAALGLSSESIEDALRGPNAQRISNTFSNMLAFLNQERHVVVRT